jgi:arylsulfatase A-like enzyme
MLGKSTSRSAAAAAAKTGAKRGRWRIGWAGLAAAVLISAGVPASAAPPNIVLILTDDMGWGDLRANNPGAKVVMPNLELMAQNGMRFTNAHTSAAHCAPTRYAVMTGNYQWRGRLSFGTWNHQEASQILPGQKTVADLLRSAGYATAFVGKLHMGGDFFAKGTSTITRDESKVDYSRPFGNGPRAHGFDYSFPLLEGIQSAPYAYFENDRLVGDASQLRQWAAGKYGRSTILASGIGMPYWDSSKVGGDVYARAVGFLDRHRANHGTSKPFFLYYSASQAHSPFTPPDSFLGKAVRGASKLCARNDMLYELDLVIGGLVSKLRAQGQLANTLFVFTADNGSNNNCGQDTSGPDFTGIKGEIGEGGHRVPFVVRWGDGSSFVIPKGTVRNQLIGVTDITATLAALAGVAPGAEQAKDSFNMLPVWRGQRGDSAPVRTHLIAEARYEGTVQVAPKFAYYEGNWKLVIRRNGSVFTPIALYNLATDKGELRDVKAANASLVTGMLARFKPRYAGPRSAPVL